MQSSVTPLDAPILDKWHDAYIHVQNIIKEYELDNKNIGIFYLLYIF